MTTEQHPYPCLDCDGVARRRDMLAAKVEDLGRELGLETAAHFDTKAALEALRQAVRDVDAFATREILDADGDTAFQCGAENVLFKLREKTAPYMGDKR
jgi:hypothetical protein